MSAAAHLKFAAVSEHSLWRLHRKHPKTNVTTGKEKGHCLWRFRRECPKTYITTGKEKGRNKYRKARTPF